MSIAEYSDRIVDNIFIRLKKVTFHGARPPFVLFLQLIGETYFLCRA